MKDGNILGINNQDEPIYRIYTKRWFLELLKSAKNGLVKLRAWDDRRFGKQRRDIPLSLMRVFGKLFDGACQGIRGSDGWASPER